MKIRPFKVEQWIDKYEESAQVNIAETCVYPMTLDELFELTGEDKDAIVKKMFSTQMTYGPIEGSDAFRDGVAGLFKTVKREEVLSSQGAISANCLLLHALVEPGDEVVSVVPTYQQLYSIPESIGAEVKVVPLSKENGFLPDLERMRSLVGPKTKMININNPNNPSGAVITNEMLREIVNIAREVDAWLLCDEVYRGLTHDGYEMESVVDMYDKAISVGSMSKVFSLSGLRMGWIVSHAPELKKLVKHHRDYSVITCGIVHDMLAGVALKHADKILVRNRAIVRENVKILEDWVATQPKISMFKPSAGTTAMLYYDLPVDSWAVCQALIDDYGTLLTPGDCFETPDSVRIGYACSAPELREGLKRLGDYIATFS
ncbi:aminotransferase [Ruminococcaceae bacterium OttesenSCG-928-A11]|nr:aminotransferase [Ruminococcaceae bacterium OttesenSCG-928-A11]